MTKPARWPRVTFLAIACTTLLLLLLVMNLRALVAAAIDWQFAPSVDFPAGPPPATAAAARAQDAAYLAHVLDVDRSFSPTARAHFRAAQSALQREAAGLTDVAFAFAAMRAVALADNAHTGLSLRSLRHTINTAHVVFAWFAEGLFVVRAAGEAVPTLGLRVLAIDNRAPEDWLAFTRPYFGGTDVRARAAATILLASPMALHALDQAAPVNDLALHLATPTGPIDVQAGTDPPAARGTQVVTALSDRARAPAALPGEDGQWRTVLRDPPRAISLRDPDKPLSSAALPGDGLYVALRAEKNNPPFRLDTALATLLDGHPAKLWSYAIVDLRGNAGGDMGLTWAFTRTLPTLINPSGRLVVITDNETFSAGIVTAGWLFASAPVPLMRGEAVGDRPRFYSVSGEPLVLPNSRLVIFYATALHDLEHGCTSSLHCYWLDPVMSVNTYPPALPSPQAWRFEDYRRGVDTVLEAALRELKVTE